jgi:hypothetical protein
MGDASISVRRVSVDERAATRAVTIAEYREWPDRLDWDDEDDEDDEDDDLEPLDLHEHDSAR